MSVSEKFASLKDEILALPDVLGATIEKEEPHIAIFVRKLNPETREKLESLLADVPFEIKMTEDFATAEGIESESAESDKPAEVDTKPEKVEKKQPEKEKEKEKEKASKAPPSDWPDTPLPPEQYEYTRTSDLTQATGAGDMAIPAVAYPANESGNFLVNTKNLYTFKSLDNKYAITFNELANCDVSTHKKHIVSYDNYMFVFCKATKEPLLIYCDVSNKDELYVVMETLLDYVPVFYASGSPYFKKLALRLVKTEF